MIFTKLSILLLYFRLFSPTKTIRIWIYVGIITTLLNHVVGTILAITLCLPSDALGYSKCAGRLNPLDVAISVINILSDFYILILPLFVISRLHMQRSKKLGVGAVFFTGFLYYTICQTRGLQADIYIALVFQASPGSHIVFRHGTVKILAGGLVQCYSARKSRASTEATFSPLTHSV
jgi:hypothetical protein